MQSCNSTENWKDNTAKLISSLNLFSPTVGYLFTNLTVEIVFMQAEQFVSF